RLASCRRTFGRRTQPRQVPRHLPFGRQSRGALRRFLERCERLTARRTQLFVHGIEFFQERRETRPLELTRLLERDITWRAKDQIVSQALDRLKCRGVLFELQ